MPRQTKQSVKPRVRNRRTAVRGRSRVERFKFFPAVLIAVFATFLSLQPHSMLPQSKSVLAYATNVSQAGLLGSTNTQRANNGAGSLSSNSMLNAAAQAKANDMVARNYWSHNTPDGQEPWVFFTNAGYEYSSAGENLAYGFMTSSDTVTGWMNSPPHKANLINPTFTEVGFGIANSPDYVGDGQQTVVVAMYGKPLNAAAPAPATPAAPAAQTPKKQAVQSAPVAEATPVAEPTPTPVPEAPATEVITDAPLDPQQPIVTAAPATVQRIQILANGNSMLSVGVLTVAVIGIGVLWLLHKGFHLRRSILAGERFVLHHIHLDLTVLAVVYLGFVLLSSTGAVR